MVESHADMLFEKKKMTAGFLGGGGGRPRSFVKKTGVAPEGTLGAAGADAWDSSVSE